MHHGRERRKKKGRKEESATTSGPGSIYLSGWDLIHCINSHTYTHRIDQRREGEDPPVAINSGPCQEIKDLDNERGWEIWPYFSFSFWFTT
jgi:hypothetical protein